jgi:hypothetical protein
MQKKENILGEAGEELGGGALGPGAVLITFGLFLLPGERPGRCFAGADDDDPTTAELSCFYCHGGGRDPTAPSENQGQGGTHLHQPCGKVGRKETLDGKEDDAAEKESF